MHNLIYDVGVCVCEKCFNSFSSMAMSTVDLGVPNAWMELPILYGVKSFRLEKRFGWL